MRRCIVRRTRRGWDEERERKEEGADGVLVVVVVIYRVDQSRDEDRCGRLRVSVPAPSCDERG